MKKASILLTIDFPSKDWRCSRQAVSLVAVSCYKYPLPSEPELVTRFRARYSRQGKSLRRERSVMDQLLTVGRGLGPTLLEQRLALGWLTTTSSN